MQSKGFLIKKIYPQLYLLCFCLYHDILCELTTKYQHKPHGVLFYRADNQAFLNALFRTETIKEIKEQSIRDFVCLATRIRLNLIIYMRLLLLS